MAISGRTLLTVELAPVFYMHRKILGRRSVAAGDDGTRQMRLNAVEEDAAFHAGRKTEVRVAFPARAFLQVTDLEVETSVLVFGASIRHGA